MPIYLPRGPHTVLGPPVVFQSDPFKNTKPYATPDVTDTPNDDTSTTTL